MHPAFGSVPIAAEIFRYRVGRWSCSARTRSRGMTGRNHGHARALDLSVQRRELTERLRLAREELETDPDSGALRRRVAALESSLDRLNEAELRSGARQ